jgi:hypothetical protein
LSQYSSDQTIGLASFEELLGDLGVLDGLVPMEAMAAVRHLFGAADTDKDGLLDYEEFATFYRGMPVTAHRQLLRTEMGLKTEREWGRVRASCQELHLVPCTSAGVFNISNITILFI